MLLTFSSGLTWHFGVTAKVKVESTTIPERYLAFADRITLDVPRARQVESSQQYLQFAPTGQLSVPIVSIVQKTAWRFNFIGSEYVCETAKAQKIEILPPTKETTPIVADKAAPENGTSGEKAQKPTAEGAARKPFMLGGLPLTVFEPRWTVQVWNNRWDICLDQNADLGIGEAVKWHADAATFFPLDGAPELFPVQAGAPEEPSEADASPGPANIERSARSVTPLPEHPNSDALSEARFQASLLPSLPVPSQDQSRQPSRAPSQAPFQSLSREPSRAPSSQGSLVDGSPSKAVGSENRSEGFELFYTRLQRVEAAIRDEVFTAEEYEEPTELTGEEDNFSDDSISTDDEIEPDEETDEDAENLEGREYEKLDELQDFFDQLNERKSQSRGQSPSDSFHAGSQSGEENSVAGPEVDGDNVSIAASAAAVSVRPTQTMPAQPVPFAGPAALPPKPAANLFADDWALTETAEGAGWESSHFSRPAKPVLPRANPAAKLGKLIDLG